MAAFFISLDWEALTKLSAVAQEARLNSIYKSLAKIFTPTAAAHLVRQHGLITIVSLEKLKQFNDEMPSHQLAFLNMTKGTKAMQIIVKFTGDVEQRADFVGKMRFVPGVGPTRAMRIANGEAMAIETTPAAIDQINAIAHAEIVTDEAKEEHKVEGEAKVAPVTKSPADALAEALRGIMGSGSIDETQLRKIVQDEVVRTVDALTVSTIELKAVDGTSITLTGHHHPMFKTLLRVCSARNVFGFVPNVWIAGPTASGKTTAAKKVAEALNLAFYAMGACSMPHELLGYKDGHGVYHETQFVKAFRDGGVIVLDELDAYENPAVLALQAALANNVMALPDATMLERHKDCIVLGTANTWGLGANADFVGRNRLDAAFLSRFAIKLDWQRDDKLEQAISGNVAWAKRVQAAREKAKAAGLKVMIDPRHSIEGAALISTGFTMDEAAEMTYLAGLSTEQRNQIGV